MRVRLFGLRLLAAVLTALWTIAAAIVLLGYRPGGPIDGVVGLASLLPIGVSLLGLLWPPGVRGDRAFAGVAWLGLGAILLLVPSIAAVITQLFARGPQTLLPSWEAVYPWILALLATSLFGGLGVARHVLGVTAMRRRRLELGLFVAVVATTLSGSAFAAAAIANEFALRDAPARSSRFGPTTADVDPPHCTAPIDVGTTAVVSVEIGGDVDGRPIGTVEINGVRSGVDVAWTANIATEVAIGQYGVIRVGGDTWTRAPRDAWHANGTIVPPAVPSRVPGASAAPSAAPAAPDSVPLAAALPALDAQVLATSLTQGYRTAAEEVGLEFVEGARARHCRIALDGPTFERAFPAATWLSRHLDLHRWRGSLDYWVFRDGQVGQVAATVNGEAQSLGRAGLQANLTATLMATDRGAAQSVQAPAS